MERASDGGWMAGLALAGAFVALSWMERRRPLRRTVEPKGRRMARNLLLAGISAATLHLVERPLVDRLSRRVARSRWGILPRLGLPPVLERIAAPILMDYTLYLWHVLTHRVPALWRLHRIHHMDLDLDSSTALRFHAAEMALSVPWRMAQVAMIGVRPDQLAAWRRLTLLAILFHHSNLRLPIRAERWLSRLIVTPRMHGIHHSIVPEETGSNWSSGLAIWDRLHGTLRLNVPQRRLTIGVPEVRRPEQAKLGKLLTLPLAGPPPSERLPDGWIPRRRHTAIPATHLLA